MSLNPQEQAQNALTEQQKAERQMAEAYARVFSTREGKAILEDLIYRYPPDRARFDKVNTKENPIAALMGGLHFDGSAVVTKYILDRIAGANAKIETPTITGS